MENRETVERQASRHAVAEVVAKDIDEFTVEGVAAQAGMSILA